MLIKDYETNRSLNDVVLTLTMEEAGELCDYLRRLQDQPELKRVHLTQVAGARLEKEFTVALEQKAGVA